MSLVETFKRQLTEYLCNVSSPSEALVIFENNSKCDFSFINKYTIWCNYLLSDATATVERCQRDLSRTDNILILASGKENEDEAVEALVMQSVKWVFRIERVERNDSRYAIHLQRSSSFKTALDTMSAIDLAYVEKKDCETMFIESSHERGGGGGGGGDEPSSISDFRLKTIESVLKNVAIHATRYVYVHDSSLAKHRLHLTTSSNFKISSKEGDGTDRVMVTCGVVLSENKKSHQTANEYLIRRTNDMHLTAIHKYGVRVKDDKNFQRVTQDLGRAAATLDMMEVKCSNAIKLASTPKQSFILYNSARLETLLANFDASVKEGYYQDVKPFSEADAALLTEDLEWQLLKFLLEYPETIKKVSCDIEKGKIGLHLLYKYLYAFMTLFSMYYSKVKVLTENRPQLMPVLHAKIHLLRAIQKYLNQTLKLFNVEPVSFM